VDKGKNLKEFVWCDHAPVGFPTLTAGVAHLAILPERAVHIVVEEGKVKILCHSCFVAATQIRIV